MDEDGSFFDHDGLRFEVEGVRPCFPCNEDQANRAVGFGTPVGHRMDVLHCV